MTMKTGEQRMAVQGLLAEVADRLENSGSDVYNRLRDEMVEKEIVDRVGLLDRAIQKRFTLVNDLRKIDKADVENFDAEGKPAFSAYSKPRIEEIRKAKEALAKIDNALDRALNANDFGKLKEICGK